MLSRQPSARQLLDKLRLRARVRARKRLEEQYVTRGLESSEEMPVERSLDPEPAADGPRGALFGRRFVMGAGIAMFATAAAAQIPLTGAGHGFYGGAGATLAAINALEVMGPSSIDPQGTGPWGFQGDGTLVRLNYTPSTTAPISNVVASLLQFTVSTPGKDNNFNAGPITAVTKNIVIAPRAVLRRQEDTTSGAGNITNTTQVCYQPDFATGTITNTPSMAMTADIFLVLPMRIYAGDVITCAALAGWNGPGSTAGAGPTVTNNSSLTSTANAAPIFGFFNLPGAYYTANPLVELQVFHRYAWLGGLGSPQAVAGIEFFASDGTTDGPVTTVTDVSLSTLQTQGNPNEVFAGTPDLSTIADSNSTGTLGPGLAYITARIHLWRGATYDIRVDGAAWPTPQPCTVHPFRKDFAGKCGGGIASVMLGGTLAATSIAGISTTYPVGRPATSAAYATPDVALKALAAWKVQTSGRPAGAITTENNAAGCRVVHFDNAGADQPFEMAASVTPVTAPSCFATLEAWTGNTGDAYYNATVARDYVGGYLRLKMRAHKNGGAIRAGDTTSNSVATILALDGKTQTWGASTATSFFQNVAMVYLRNVTMVSPTFSNSVAMGMGQQTGAPYRCSKAIGVIVGDNTTSHDAQMVPFHVAGCRGNFTVGGPTSSRQSTNDGGIVANTSFNALTGTLYDFKPSSDISGSADAFDFVRGFALVQNTFEGINTAGSNIGFQAGSTTRSVRNVLILQNTGAHSVDDDNALLNTTGGGDDRGGLSIEYRDNIPCLGSTADVVVANNIATRFAWKAGYFTIFQQGGTGVGAAGLGQVGNYALLYGVEVDSNCMPFNRAWGSLNDASNFAGRVTGPLSVSNTGIVTWVDDRARTIAWAPGMGWGDYHLKDAAAGGNNVGKDMIAAGKQWSRYDQGGHLRKTGRSGVTNTLGAAGAFEATD